MKDGEWNREVRERGNEGFRRKGRMKREKEEEGE